MSKSVLSDYQPSLTEWYAVLGKVDDSNQLRHEDNHKADRLEFLYQIIGLPYERPEIFDATELNPPSHRFQRLLDERGEELCAIRLVPKKPDLPKLRNRGQSIKDCYNMWFLKQDIDPKNYTAYVCPHTETQLWSTIFVITANGIFGEIVDGLHNQLTHGDRTNQLRLFSYDFKKWHWQDHDIEAEKYVKRMIELLCVQGKEKRALISKEIDVKFAHNYLIGYFEAIIWPDKKPYFSDYNRLLPKYLTNKMPTLASKSSLHTLKGQTVFPGGVTGTVVIVTPDDIPTAKLDKNSILVCMNTDVRYLPLMQKAAAIITEQGGILSHAAIVARELGKPCIVNVKKVTNTLRNGDQISLDAKGTIVKK